MGRSINNKTMSATVFILFRFSANRQRSAGRKISLNWGFDLSEMNEFVFLLVVFWQSNGKVEQFM